MKQWLKKLSRLGADSVSTPEERDAVVLTNYASMVVGTLCFLTIPVMFLVDARVLGLLLVPIGLIYFTVLMLNHQGVQAVAALVFYVNFSIGLFFYISIMGSGFGMEYLFFAVMIASHLLFVERHWHWFGSIFAMVLLLVFEYGILNPFSPLILSENQRLALQISILPSCLIIFLVITSVAFKRYGDQIASLEHKIMQVHTDQITGLANEFQLENDLKQHYQGEGVTQSWSSVVVMCSFNGLKEVNEKYSYATGNQLLRDFSLLLVQYFGGERLYRFGSDRFAIWSADFANLDDRLETIDSEFRQLHFDGSGVTFGVAKISEAESASQILQLADQRLQSQQDPQPERVLEPRRH